MVADVLGEFGVLLGKKECDPIVVGGEILYSHDAVEETVVFGELSDKWGEKVIAVIATESDDLDEEILSEFLNGRLANFKRPKEYVFTDELPKSGSGKVQRPTIIDRHTPDDARRRIEPRAFCSPSVARFDVW